MQNKRQPQTFPWLVVLLLAAAWFFYPLGDYFALGTEDEMVILYGSHRILHGQFPHVDFFTPLPPLTMTLMAAWWYLVGESLFSARILLGVVFAVSALLLYQLGRRLLPAWAAAFASLLFLTEVVSWTAWSQNWLNAPLYLGAVLLLVRHAEKPGRFTMARAGVGAGICFLNTQYIGAVATVLAVIVACTEAGWSLKRRRLGELAAGLMAVLLPCFLVYAGAGALSAVWRDQFLFPFYGYAGFNRFTYQPFPNFELIPGGLASVNALSLSQAWEGRAMLLDFFSWPARTLLTHTLFYPLTLVFFLVAFARWWSTGERVLCILAVGQLGLSMATLTRPDGPHLAYGRTLWWVLLMAALLELWRRAPRKLSYLALPVTGLLLLSVLVQGWTHRRRWVEAPYPVRFPLEVVRVRELPLAQALATTIAMVEQRSRAGDFIFAYPWNPAFYLLTGRENPCSNDRLLPFYDSPAEFERIFSQLEEADERLKLVLLFNINVPMYLSQYPSVPVGPFEEIYRGFERRLQDRFGDRVLRTPF